jgi:hypothetical protein
VVPHFVDIGGKERIISNHSVDAEETDELKKIKKVFIYEKKV